MFEDFYGNETAKSLVEIGVKAARKKQDRLPHYLFSGMAGAGKTMLANLTAEEANAIKVYINASTIATTQEIVETLVSSFKMYNENEDKDRIVVLVDEAHALKGPIEDFLLTAISEDSICVKEAGRIKNFKIEQKASGVNNFLSWIFITNRCGEVANALRSRLVDVQFIKYTESQKKEIAKSYLIHKGISIHGGEEDSVYAEIARRSWSARDVKRFINELHDFVVATDVPLVTTKTTNDYFELVGIDKNGLNQLDKAYLNIILESGNKASLQTISSKLNIGKKDVTEMIEPRLLDLGMIEIRSGGRSVVDVETVSTRNNPFSVGE